MGIERIHEEIIAEALNLRVASLPLQQYIKIAYSILLPQRMDGWPSHYSVALTYRKALTY